VLAGVAVLPSFGLFVEHLAMGLAFRGAYKSLGGSDWFWETARSIGFITTDEATPEPHAGAARA
jgi:hypothetical protein